MAQIEYDQSGHTFLYFILTLLSLYLIPSTLSYYREYAGSDGKDKRADASKCRCEPCIRKRRLMETKNAKKSKVSLGFVMWITAWIVFVVIAHRCATAAPTYEEWDPYKILNIEKGATVAEVRKQYRHLSRTLHPDKNPDDPLASEKFNEIAKAHEALTDDTARENWEKYGNPDGPRSTTFGIALPQWIVERENKGLVVGMYFLAFMVILPIAVGTWWYRSRRYLEGTVLIQTLRHYRSHIGPNMTIDKLVQVLAFSDEFRELLHLRRSDNLESVLKSFPDPLFATVKEKERSKSMLAYIIKARTLIMAHLYRVELSPDLKSDLAVVLAKTPMLIRAMADPTYVYLDQPHTLRVTQLCMHMSQMIVQAVWDSISPLVQVPHYTPEIGRHFNTKKRNIKTIYNLVDMPDEDRRSLLRSLSDESYEDVMEFLRTYPYVDMEIKHRSDGSPDGAIYAGSIVTVDVRLRRMSYFEYLSLKSTTEKAKDIAPKAIEAPALSKKARKRRVKDAAPTADGTVTAVEAADADADAGGESDGEDKEETNGAVVAGAGAGVLVVSGKKEGVEKENGKGDEQVEKEDDDDEDTIDWEHAKQLKRPLTEILDKGDKYSHPVHAPHFPEAKQEHWWLFVGDEKANQVKTKPQFLEGLKSSPSFEFTDFEIMMRAPEKAGDHRFTVFLVSDAYLGCDQKATLRMNVVDPPPETLAARTQPTENVADGDGDAYDDEYDEEDEESASEAEN